MSTAQSDTDVMVRAYGGEPVQLRALERRGQVIVVAGADPNKTIGFPAKDVFRFDPDAFDVLRKTYQRGDRERLVALWKKATQF